MRLGGAIAATMLVAAAPAAASDGPPTACPFGSQCPPPATHIEVLSKPGHVSRWAFVLKRVIARREPTPESKAVARLRLKTQDGTDELVLALARETDAYGRRWVQVRLPILPNGSTGWVRDNALGAFHRVHTWLRINTRRLRATLIRSGKRIFRAPIGVGHPRWPTPTGQFFIRDRLEGFPADGLYGPLAFGLNARSAVLTEWPGGGFVGIHGTDRPSLIPGHPSHGCIRMRNPDILRLGRLMPVGTPVTIS